MSDPNAQPAAANTQPPAGQPATSPSAGAGAGASQTVDPGEVAKLREENAQLRKVGQEAVSIAKESKAALEAFQKRVESPEFLTEVFTKRMGTEKPIDPTVALKAKDEEVSTLKGQLAKISQRQHFSEALLSDPEMQKEKLGKALKMFRTEGYADALEYNPDFSPKDPAALKGAVDKFKSEWKPEFFTATVVTPQPGTQPSKQGGPPLPAALPPGAPNPQVPGAPKSYSRDELLFQVPRDEAQRVSTETVRVFNGLN